MYKSKLIRLLQKLSKRELSRFADFVQSPYFNKSTEIISFYKYLLPFGPAFSHKKLKKEQVIAHFKKEEKFSDQTLVYRMNGLVQLLELFLSVEDFQKDDFQIQSHLIQSYQGHHMKKNALKILENAKKGLVNQPLQNAEFFYNSFLVFKTAYEQTSSGKQAFTEELQEVSNRLDVYYLVEKLRYCCKMLNLENILNVKYDLQLGDEILRFLEGHHLAKVPAIALYLNVLKMLRNKEDDDYFQKVRYLIDQYGALFSTAELKEFYTSILNYCTFRINRFNDGKYRTEYLDINKALLKKGLLFEKDELSPWRYTNLVNVGLKTKQVEWTRLFIEEYKEKLPEEYRESMYAYNSGLMNYYLKNYEQAQRLIFNIEIKDIPLNILNRSLLVKIYYESDQTELLLFSLEANRIFLLRNKLIDAKLKTQMKNFIDFTKKLAKIDVPEAHKLLPLKAQLPEASGVMHRDWLIEQMNKKIKKLNPNP